MTYDNVVVDSEPSTYPIRREWIWGDAGTVNAAITLLRERGVFAGATALDFDPGRGSYAVVSVIDSPSAGRALQELATTALPVQAATASAVVVSGWAGGVPSAALTTPAQLAHLPADQQELAMRTMSGQAGSGLRRPPPPRRLSVRARLGIAAAVVVALAILGRLAWSAATTVVGMAFLGLLGLVAVTALVSHLRPGGGHGGGQGFHWTKC